MLNGHRQENETWRLSYPVLIATQAYPPLGGGSSTIMKNLLDPIDKESIVLAVQRPTPDKEKVAAPSVHKRHFVERLTTLPGKIEQLRRYFWRPAVERRLVRLARNKGCFAVVGVFPDIFFLDVAMGAARRLGVPFLPYLHDTIAESLAASPFSVYAKKVQDKVFASAKRIMVVTGGMAELYRDKYGIDAVLVRHIYPERIETHINNDEVNNAFLWSGNIYDINNASLKRVFNVVKKLGIAKFTMCTLQSTDNLSRLGFSGNCVTRTYIPVAKRPDYLETLRRHGALILALNWPDESQIHVDELRTIFPTKTPEYLAAGRPIIVHCPEYYYLAQFFRQHSCGVVITERSESAIRRGIHSIMQSKTKRESIVKNALRTANRFSANSVLPKFVGSIEEALNS